MVGAGCAGIYDNISKLLYMGNSTDHTASVKLCESSAPRLACTLRTSKTVCPGAKISFRISSRWFRPYQMSISLIVRGYIYGNADLHGPVLIFEETYVTAKWSDGLKALTENR